MNILKVGLYKWLHRKKVSQAESLFEASLDRYIDFYRKHFCARTFDEVFNHYKYGAFDAIGKGLHDKEERKAFKQCLSDTWTELELCRKTSIEEYIEQSCYRDYPVELKRMVVREIRLSATTCLVVPSKSLFDELVAMDTDEVLQVLFKEYLPLLSSGKASDGADAYSSFYQCDMPMRIRLKFYQYLKIHVRLLHYVPYWEGVWK